MGSHLVNPLFVVTILMYPPAFPFSKLLKNKDRKLNNKFRIKNKLSIIISTFEDLIINVFIKTDGFCKVFIPVWNKYLINNNNNRRRYKHRINTLTESEIIIILILLHYTYSYILTNI